MNNFTKLAKYHDTVALDFVLEKLKKYGQTEVIKQGHEYDSNYLSQQTVTDL